MDLTCVTDRHNAASQPTSDLVVDLFAGPGGWDEGMAALGIRNVIGIEWDKAACDTANTAGHRRIQADVSTVAIDPFIGRTSGLVASPPCQAWSMAGTRRGELDRARAHQLVDAYARGANDPGAGWADDRSHHAAQPVRWIRDIRPQWVALEQVPPVLGLWQHISHILRGWGYNTWAGILSAADAGAPQTRDRAILMARRGAPVGPPTPTHAEHPHTDLFGDELAPWATIASALGRHGINRHGWTFVNGAQGNATIRRLSEPAGTILCSRPGNLRWVNDARTEAATVTEAAILQGFRPDYPWRGTKTQRFQQVANAVPPPLSAAVVGALTGAVPVELDHGVAA